MGEKNDLLSFMKSQIAIEKEIVEAVNKGLKSIRNPPVRGVLRGISLDSMKHAELYSAAITLLTQVSQALTQDDLDAQRELVEKHIQMEAELIKKLEKVTPSIENKKVKFLLRAIFDDERRHHAMLKVVLEIIVRGETISEDDWWDLLWKDSPFHGSPGG
jgi:hypothetical protein